MNDDSAQLVRAREDVARKYADLADRDTVTTEFDAIVGEFDEATIRTFVPVLAERMLRQRLVEQRRP